MLPFAEKDLRKEIPAQHLARGRAYQEQGRVRDLQLHADGTLLSASVQGSDKKPYRTEIVIRNVSNQIHIHGSCACPVGHNCKHVAATLLEALEQKPPEPAIPPAAPNHALRNWLENLERAARDTGKPREAAQPSERLLYILKLDRRLRQARAWVEIVVARLLKDGGYGKAQRWNGNLVSHARFVGDIDRDILRWLEALRYDQVGAGFGTYALPGSAGAHVLARMLSTGRCHWLSKDSPVLAPGDPRAGAPAWRVDEVGAQHLICDGQDIDAILPMSPPWYVDVKHAQCGPLKTDLPDALAEMLFAAPTLAPEDAETAHAILRRYFSAASPALPKVFDTARLERPTPVPMLRLFRDSLPIDYGHQWQLGGTRLDWEVATLHFDYAGVRVETGEAGEFRTRMQDGQLLRIARNPKLEAGALQALADYGFTPLAQLRFFSTLPKRCQHALTLNAENREQALLRFSLEGVPALQAQGWRIEMESDYRYRIAVPDPEWYAHLDSDSLQADMMKAGLHENSHDWFGVELGVSVDGARVNLLPLVVQWLQDARRLRLDVAGLPDQHIVLAHLPDGRLLPIPLARVRQVLAILTELYDEQPLNARGQIKLTRAQATQLSALAEDLGPFLLWSGETKLQELAQRLREFRGLVACKESAALRATLRPYQREGLAWLQFLREYGFGGILADDMGLGKTVQALAHLQLEKDAGRLDRPALVVAPTSVLVNWRREAERLAPNLRVLTLHGSERKQDFEKIAAQDLVLTSYALLVRDAEIFAAHAFHSVILDEAQAIKNPRAKAADVARRLDTRHRLCLTGTPMENHLGELWSLFHFLMPGWLGDERRFRRLFRTPIEKHGDSERRAALARRLKPFLLRRTKEQVATELPAKNEIVREVELAGAQRDLYESIRVALHDKVRQEVEKHGLARSQIVILDALLKLRQVCCDPRLLKLDAAKKVRQSAKLELLLDMLPELIAEGRRVLLFSQFTSMLGLIETELKERGIDYALLTGDTKDRATPIDRFQSGALPLFLISLKAGGTGLNLTAADTVIHYDPWWNPAVERQATDRAHRIGQEKTVFVYKLITQGTVEEKIAALQTRKQALAEGVFGKAGAEGPAFSAEDLELLFAAAEG